METAITQLSDRVLIEKLEALSSKEIETTVELILHLAEVDRRKLYLDAGYSSLFRYCTEGKLRYCESAANRRIACARLLSRFPQLGRELLTKEVSPTTLSLAAGIINDENYEEVLRGIRGKARRDVEAFVATYRPRRAIPRESIKPIVVATSVPSRSTSGDLFGQQEKSSVKSTAARGGNKKNEYPQVDTAPIVEQRYELKFSVDAETMKEIEEAKICLSGKYRRPTTEQVFKEGLKVLLEKRSSKRRSARRMERTSVIELKHKAGSREVTASPARPIPQAIRDQIFERDGGCCTYVSKEGVRCLERFDLEIHHEQPFAQNGSHAPENLSLRCRAHNLHQALQDYGSEHMQRYLGTSWNDAAKRFTLKELARADG